jgi:ATP/maltotriose-dependent transcriptional regulator MalT/two-component SAPR family response regulator
MKGKAQQTRFHGAARRARIRTPGTRPQKISVPFVGEVMARSRLFQRLDEAAMRPITWIAGPGGAGKTVLVASYLAAQQAACLWYQIDAGDQDLAAFFHYLALSTTAYSHSSKPVLPSLTPEYLAGVEIFARRFFEQLFALPDIPPMLVLDNYEDLPADAPLHGILASALAQLPNGVRVIVMSRRASPPAWARTVARGMIARLGWQELKLTATETAQIARFHGMRQHGDLAEVDLVRLHDLTQGWAAGVVLMLEQHGERGFAQGVPIGHAEQATFDYFAREIFERQSPNVQNALLQLAWMPAVSRAAALALTGRRDTLELLAQLAQSHSFTYELGEENGSYRFHPLFQAFLQAQARAKWESGYCSEVLRASARCLIGEHRVEDAAQLLIAAQDWTALTQLALGNAQAMLAQGRHRTLEAWIAALPQPVCEQVPWLLLYLGAARFPHDISASRHCYELAFAHFDRAQDFAGRLAAWCAVVEAIATARHDNAVLRPWIALAERRLVPHYATLGDAALVHRFNFAMFLALTSAHPDHADQEKWAARLESSLAQMRDTSQWMLAATFLLAYYSAAVGNEERATAVYDAMQRLAVTQLTPAARVQRHTMLAFYTFCFHRSELQTQDIEQAIAIAQDSGAHFWDGIVYGTAVQLSLCAQDYTAAARYLGDMQRGLSAQRPLEVGFYEVLMGWLALACADNTKAYGHVRRATALAQSHGGFFEQCTAQLLHALAAQRCGDLAQAREQLSQAQAKARAMRSPRLVFMGGVYAAHILFVQNQDERGLDELRTAFRFGAQHHYLSMLFMLPAVLADACARALAADIEPEFARTLIRTHRLSPAVSTGYIEQWPWPFRVYTLGRFGVVKVDGELDLRAQGRKKPLELFKTLLAYGGREVSQDKIIAALWPDADGDTGQQSFDTTLHRLRKCLGEPAPLSLKDGRLTLDARVCWVDAWAFERCVSSLEARQDMNEEQAQQHLERLLPLYRGAFLEREENLAAALLPRERLASRFRRAVNTLAQCHAQAHRTKQAIDLYQRALEVDPLAEALHQRLIHALHTAGRLTEAFAAYSRCRAILRMALGTEPTAQTQTLYQSLMTHQSIDT